MLLAAFHPEQDDVRLTEVLECGVRCKVEDCEGRRAVVAWFERATMQPFAVSASASSSLQHV